jgi:hypothetical protein
MIVPGGGLSPDGARWIACRPGFFLPVRVLSRLFRRLFLEGLAALHKAGQLQVFGDLAGLADPAAFAAYLAPLRKAEWVVYAKPPFGGPEAVLAYLSRYTHRVAISNSRLISADADTVAFRWKDYRIKTGDRQKVMRLATDEFIRRFLIHVLPDGFHRIRHYGLLGRGHAQSHHRPDPHPARGGNPHGTGPADPKCRGHPAHPARALSLLRRANADRRDLPARRAADDPRSATEGRRMTRCTSPWLIHHRFPSRHRPHTCLPGLPQDHAGSRRQPDAPSGPRFLTTSGLSLNQISRATITPPSPASSAGGTLSP